jgi:hypothetical protein
LDGDGVVRWVKTYLRKMTPLGKVGNHSSAAVCSIAGKSHEARYRALGQNLEDEDDDEDDYDYEGAATRPPSS